MNRELRQLLLVFTFVVFELSVLWFGATFSSSDMKVRNECHAQGVANLPQGVDQTLLQTQSKAYKECLVKK